MSLRDAGLVDISALEAGLVDEVALDRVLQVGVPVDLDRARDVADVVEQHVLVGLDDADLGISRCSATHSVDTNTDGS